MEDRSVIDELLIASEKLSNTSLFQDIPELQNPLSNVESYVNTLAEEILCRDVKHLSIGIYGGYGSGKSTMLALLEHAVLSTRSADDGVFVIKFEAWRFEREESLFVPLLLTIREQLASSDEKLYENITLACKAFLTGLKFKLGIVEWKANESLVKENELKNKGLISASINSFNIFKEFSDSGKRKIIILVDDLDRCFPDKALELLESIKSYLNIDGFVFVFALDPRVIKTYVSSKYGNGFEIDAEEYLRKIIQVPINVPLQKNSDIIKFIEQANLSSVSRNAVMKIAKYLPKNFRQIKRLLNKFHIVKMSNQSFSEDDFLISLVLLQSEWPEYFEIISSNVTLFSELWSKCRQNNESYSVKGYQELSGSLERAVQDSRFVDFYENNLYQFLRYPDTCENYFDVLGKI